MNYKFIQPVSMRVTKEQYERDLKPSLLILGYEECFGVDGVKDWKSYDILVTNSSGENGVMTNVREERKHIGYRYFIDHYNPKLFLAIAAMTDKESPIVGEWLVCIDEMAYIISGYKVGEFVKNGNPNMTLNWFRKAALQELINKFTNKETIKENAMKKELTQELIKDLKNLIAPENVKKFDELMGIKKPIPKKEELITGDKVILRNGEAYLLIRDCNAGGHGRQVFTLLECKILGNFAISNEYDEKLCSKSGFNKFDIMKIYRYAEGRVNCLSMSEDIDGYTLIWER